MLIGVFGVYIVHDYTHKCVCVCMTVCVRVCTCVRVGVDAYVHATHLCVYVLINAHDRHWERMHARWGWVKVNVPVCGAK